MKVLFIGGTGNISSAVSRLAVSVGIDLYHLNRGIRKADFPGVKAIRGDITKPEEVARAIAGHQWDAVVNWIAFTVPDVERDIQLFAGKTRQYIFISSASAYQKPPVHPVITESTPLANPFWDYSRNKIACEERLMRAYREQGFPFTIVRPSLTYDTGNIPVAIGGWQGYAFLDHIRRGKPAVVHGDGSSLWTVTHSEDFAAGFVPLLANQQTIGHAFHITSDEVLTWNQIYEAVAAAAGVEVKIVHIPSDVIADMAEKLGQKWMRGNLLGDKSWSCIFDNSKVKSFAPGFAAKDRIMFAEGMRRAVAWFDADASRRKVPEGQPYIVDQLLEAWTARRF